MHISFASHCLRNTGRSNASTSHDDPQIAGSWNSATSTISEKHRNRMHIGREEDNFAMGLPTAGMDVINTTMQANESDHSAGLCPLNGTSITLS